MRKGQSVAFRLQQPNQYDNGWRAALVVGRTNKGYTLTVFLDPQFDRDRGPSFTGIMHAHNCKPGEEVGQFTEIDMVPGLDGEKPGEPESDPVIVTKSKPVEDAPTTHAHTPAAPATAPTGESPPPS